MSIEEDREQLEEIEADVRQWLRERKVPSTMQNVLRALAMLSYMDWINGEEAFPMGTPETWTETVFRWLKRLLGKRWK